MKKIGLILVLLTSCCSGLFSQMDSYTIWIGETEIFAHHETDVGDTVDVKRSLFTNVDTLIAEYHHMGSQAHGSSTRLTLKDDQNHLLRGESNMQNQVAHKAGMPMSTILKNWKLDTVKFLSVSLVIHNEGESSAHGFKIGVLRLVD
jgi:hypothetical protein